MTHPKNDPFGNEASRPQDAIPIDEAGRLPADPHADLSEETESEASQDTDLKGLAGLAPSSANGRKSGKAGAGRRSRRAATGAAAGSSAAPLEAAAGGEGDAVRELEDLEAKGFTLDEARRLIDITARLKQSAEAREAEATLRRLHFTRWLLDHGRLDEWSA